MVVVIDEKRKLGAYNGDDLMITLRRKVLCFTLILLVNLLVIGFIWQYLSIQHRLSRNSEVTQQLVQSLKARFPESEFRGAASYEREIIYITVMNRLSEDERQDVERWLQKQKIQQKIKPQVRLRIANDLDKEYIIN